MLFDFFRWLWEMRCTAAAAVLVLGYSQDRDENQLVKFVNCELSDDGLRPSY